MEIWKFIIYPIGLLYVEMPEGAKIISADWDCTGKMCCWAIVNPEAPKEKRALWCGGTGWELPEGFEYIGMIKDDPYIWHLGEVCTKGDQTR